MLKRLLLCPLLLPGIANAQFINGQVLTANQLNSAFANTLPLGGGILTGPLTVPSLSVTGSPIGVASGGTGATTAIGVTSNLQFLSPLTSALSRSVSSKLSDVVSVMDFGATGDCSTDDSTEIQNAINSLPNGGTVNFPQPPGGCYAIGGATTITMPTTVSIALVGAGRNSTILRATAAMNSIITFGNVFFYGHKISDLTLDANLKAAYTIYAPVVDGAIFSNLQLLNATTEEFLLGNSHDSPVVIENQLDRIQTDSPAATSFSQYPLYNIEIGGTNNNIQNIKAKQAQTANIYSDVWAANNTYVAVHGYNYSSPTIFPPSYNILVNGYEEQITDCEGDGASVADIQLNGNENVLAECMVQFSGITAAVGIQFGATTGGNALIGNRILNSTTANSIVQSGSQASPGNYAINNINGTTKIIVDAGPLNANDLTGTSQAKLNLDNQGIVEWAIVNNSSSSNSFALNRYSSGTLQDAPISVSNSTGLVTLADGIAASTANLTGPLTVGYSTPSLIINDVSGTNNQTLNFESNGSSVWAVRSSSGDVFQINRYTSGTFTDTPIGVSGSTGIVTIPDGLTLKGTTLNPNLSGTTGSIGGSALVAGACSSGTVSITGAATGMAIMTTPVTYPGTGFDWNRSYVSATNTVTVQVCADVAGTPAASAYNVRVIQ